MHSADVFTIWYFFSLSFIITMLLVLWGIQQGAFDENGNLQGTTGDLLRQLKLHVTDPASTAVIAGAAVVTLIVPQLFAYMFSGIFGCASAPWLVRTGVSIFVWSLIKFFVVVAGVAASLGVFEPSQSLAIGNFGVAVILVSTAFVVLYFYRKSEQLASWVYRRFPASLQYRLAEIHNAATRYRSSNDVAVHVPRTAVEE